MSTLHLFLILILGTSLVWTKSHKLNKKKSQLRYETVLEAIRANQKLSNREKYDLELNLSKAFQVDQAKKKEEQRKKLEALERKKEEEIYRKHLVVNSALKDFHPMRYF